MPELSFWGLNWSPFSRLPPLVMTAAHIPWLASVPPVGDVTDPVVSVVVVDVVVV